MFRSMLGALCVFLICSNSLADPPRSGATTAVAAFGWNNYQRTDIAGRKRLEWINQLYVFLRHASEDSKALIFDPFEISGTTFFRILTEDKNLPSIQEQKALVIALVAVQHNFASQHEGNLLYQRARASVILPAYQQLVDQGRISEIPDWIPANDQDFQKFMNKYDSEHPGKKGSIQKILSQMVIQAESSTSAYLLKNSEVNRLVVYQPLLTERKIFSSAKLDHHDEEYDQFSLTIGTREVTVFVMHAPGPGSLRAAWGLVYPEKSKEEVRAAYEKAVDQVETDFSDRSKTKTAFLTSKDPSERGFIIEEINSSGVVHLYCERPEHTSVLEIAKKFANWEISPAKLRKDYHCEPLMDTREEFLDQKAAQYNRAAKESRYAHNTTLVFGTVGIAGALGTIYYSIKKNCNQTRARIGLFAGVVGLSGTVTGFLANRAKNDQAEKLNERMSKVVNPLKRIAVLKDVGDNVYYVEADGSLADYIQFLNPK